MGFFKPALNSKHDHLSLIVLGAGAFALGLTICRLWMNRPDFEQHKAPSNSENPPHEDEHDNDHEDDHERLRLSSAPLTPIRGRQYSLLDNFPLPPSSSSSTIDELAKPASLNGHSSHLLQQQKQDQQQQENQQQHPSSTSQSTISSPTSPFTPPSHSPISSAEEEQQTQQQTQQEKFNWTNFSQNENLLPTPPPPFSSSSSSPSSPHFSPSPSSPSSSSSSSPPSPKRKQTHQTHQNPSSSPNFFSGTSAWPRELPRRMIVPPELTTTTATNEQPFIFRGMASSLSSLLQEEKEGSCGGSGGEKD